MPNDEARSDLSAVLRARGMRSTPQRAEVLAAVRRLGHATPEQLAAELPAVDLTTVYRTLDLLEELGLVSHMHLHHGAPSYRPAGDPHVHVICHSCSSVIEVPPNLTDDLVARLQNERDFVVDLAHFTVFGYCSSCRAEGGGNSPALHDDQSHDDSADSGHAHAHHHAHQH